MYATARPVLKEWKQSGLSPKKKDLKEVQIAKGGEVINQWNLELDSILQSPRKVKGKFHTPKIDKDNEYIENEAIQNAIPDFMHLPILHDFHKERTVGIVTKVTELADGSFDFEGLIKATDDCKDIWDLISTGKYDQVSIFGKRTGGSASCNLKPEQRTRPCTTTGVRLDSISVCDDNARNDGTFLAIAKSGKVVFEATDTIIKAETTSSSLMHTKTDGCPKRKIPTMNFVDYDPTKDVSSPHYIDPNAEPKSPNFVYSVAGSHLQRPFKKAGGTHVTGKLQNMIDQLTERISEMVAIDTEKKGKLPKSEGGANTVARDNRQRVAQDDLDNSRRNSAQRARNKPRGSAPGAAVNRGEPGQANQASRNAPYEKPSWDNTTSDEPSEEGKYESGKNYRNEAKDEVSVRGDKNENIRRPAIEREVGSAGNQRSRTDVEAPNTPTGGGGNVPAKEDEPISSRPKKRTDKAPEPHNTMPEGKMEDNEKREPKYYGTNEAKLPGAKGEPLSVENPPEYKEKPFKKEPYQGSKYTEHIDPNNEAPKRKQNDQGNDFTPTTKDRPPKESVAREDPEPDNIQREQVQREVEPQQDQRVDEKAGDEPDFSEGEPAEVEMDEPEEGIYTSLKRLGEAISQLTASDEQVHEELEEEEFEGEEPEDTEEGLGGFEKKSAMSDGISAQSGDWKSASKTIKRRQESLPPNEKLNSKNYENEPRRGQGVFGKARTEDMNDEEVNTIVKAKVDEITKAYKVELDELKTRIEKMESETISKSGVVAILREGDPDVGEVAMTNAGAVASMGKKAKV